MPTFDITAPNGKVFEVTGETAEGALKALQKSLGTQTTEQSQPVSQVEDVGKSLGSGLVRGGIGLLELPELVGRGVARLGQEGLQAVGLTESKDIPVLDTATGRFLRDATTLDDYEAKTTAGKYAGTIGEFLPAAAGPGGLLATLGRAGVLGTAGALSEAGGQALEGTKLELPARLLPALVAPGAIRSATNKTLEAFGKKSRTSPSLETLRNNKNASYEAFEKAGGDIKVRMDDVIQDIEDEIVKNEDMFLSYVPRLDANKPVDEFLKTVKSFKGKEFNLTALDKLKSSTYANYKNSGFDPRVNILRNKLDDAIENASTKSGGDKAQALLNQARANNRTYKKVQIFDELMEKAELQTAATGSGGNIVNKYRQALVKIVTDKNKSRAFDEQEIQLMKSIIDGKTSDNVLRLVGKLSPNGNGLMTFLNLAAVSTNPAFLAITSTAMGAKRLADKRGQKGIKELRELVSSGTMQGKKFTDDELRAFIGVLAGQKEE